MTDEENVAQAEDTRAEAATGDDQAPQEERPEPATPEEVAEAAKEFLVGLLGSLKLAAEVETSVEDGTAQIDVTGEGLGILIGRRGQTLDALQELTRTAVQRRVRSRARLLIDVEGYRRRRRDSLAEYARSMAERAKERGTEIELEPMTAYERKVVHDAVSEIDGASSFSEGEEPNRKVVIRGE
ncbi:MAG: KH domain-containing protein [Actinomycetota bacterium]|nr:KH domain-containing protein [Actinomycetota bacterium]